MNVLPANDVIASLIDEFRPGGITTIYGNAASGKTTTCMMAVIEAAKKGWKTIYIDNENSFDTDRLSQIQGGNVDAVLENLFLIRPRSFHEQHAIILKLPKLCANKKVKMIIVDTIGIHYRLAVKENLRPVNSELIIQMNLLEKMAGSEDKIVLLTNQAGSRLDRKDEIKMVGGGIVENSSKCIIELHKKEDKRYATLIKFRTKEDIPMVEKIGKIAEYRIIKKGLVLC
jgi:DNA repair protein RadB